MARWPRWLAASCAKPTGQGAGKVDAAVRPIIAGGLIGLTIAAPIGPIAILCIGRTLARGRLAGVVTGLGCATVHAGYGIVTMLGGDAVASFLQAHGSKMRLAGGVSLLLLGLLALARTVRPMLEKPKDSGLASDYASTVAIALLNPMTLTGFLAGMAAFGIGETDVTRLVVGMVVGSASWYVVLCLVVAAVRHHLTPATMSGFNRLTALATCALGVATAIQAL